MRTSPTRRWLWALLPVAVLALALAFGLRDAIRDVIVVPLAYLAWFADLVLASVPQAAYLAMLVLAGAVLAVRALLPIQAARPPASRPARETAESSRLRYWARHLNQLDRSQFSREKTAADLKELLLDALAGQDPAARAEAEARILSGGAGAPDDAARLVAQEAGWLGALPAGRAERWTAWWRARAGRRHRTPSIDRVARVADFAERAVDSQGPEGEGTA